jgi:hypothetical protein
MRARIDLTGQRFGRLTVLRFVEVRRSQSMYACLCDCGQETMARAERLKNGKKRSCGCLMREVATAVLARGRLKHGFCLGGFPRWYHIYLGMVARCTNTAATGFQQYGGRGIRVCDRWLKSPADFLADMGEPPEDLSLDRIDNDGPYSPENCRWATRVEQQNNRRCNRNITHQGKTQSLSEWAREIGLTNATLTKRLRSWSVDMALTAPVAQNKSSRYR